MSEHNAGSLVAIERALLRQDTAQLRDLYAALDRESCNKRLLAAGEKFGFHTAVVEEEPFNGWRVMLGRDLARVMYRTTDTSGIRQIMSTYGIELISIRGVVGHLRQFLKHEFQLSRHDTQSNFATWKHFLTVGMHGQTEYARVVKEYLLATEEQSRIAEEAREQNISPPTSTALPQISERRNCVHV